MAMLDPYVGPWTRREAAHLLRRSCFGATSAEIDRAVTDGLPATLATMIAPLPAPVPPVDPRTGQTYVTGTYDQMMSAYYNRVTKAWWIERMLLQPVSLQEKLVLFWMNHFVTEMEAVQNPQYCYAIQDYLRINAFGNFKHMVRDITLMPAMLRYLNGNTNTVGNPNENYARELQELFTIGKGAEVGPGDYTNYTEQDVREAARVLTGWRDARLTGETTFNFRQHDTGDKRFSGAYGNRTIAGRSGADAGTAELNDLVDMIFDQDETSRYVIRRLYRWFVNSDIDDDIEREVIRPLALTFRQNGFVVGPILRTLFASTHFHDDAMHGCALKSPADFIIGLLRSIGSYALPTDALQRYQFCNNIVTALAAQQMDPGSPPNVAGWPAYYQVPDYYRIWLNTATLPLRNGYTDQLIIGRRGGLGLFDSIAYVRSIPDANDPYLLVDEVNMRLFAVEFTNERRTALVKDVLQNGAPDYEWTTEWEGFLADPDNAMMRSRMKTKLDGLFRYLFRMAEFQLL